MELIEKDFRQKTFHYRVRLGERQDEMTATHEASRILSSEAAKSYIKKQSIGIVTPSAAGFAQSRVRRKALHVLSRATTPRLALLVLQSSAHVKHGADPFGKVQSMIKGMLTKLNEQQAREATQAAFCDTEMKKTTMDQKRKGDDVQKLKDRMDALSSELTEVKADIADASKDLKEIGNATAEAINVRKKEKKVAADGMKVYKDASALLRKACKVLQNVYQKKERAVVKGDKGKAEDRRGLGGGIIAILEIAIDDFDKSYKDTKENEETAAKDFQDMQSESATRTAVFKKDLEYNSRTKAELELEINTMTQDLKSDHKSLKTIGSYMEKLKASCVIKGSSYEERKVRRDADLKSLEQALSILLSSR